MTSNEVHEKLPFALVQLNFFSFEAYFLIFEMKIAISLFAAANGNIFFKSFDRPYQIWRISYVLAGLTVSVEKPVTPRSRGVTYCMGCAAADDGQFPWQVSLQGKASRRKTSVR